MRIIPEETIAHIATAGEKEARIAVQQLDDRMAVLVSNKYGLLTIITALAKASDTADKESKREYPEGEAAPFDGTDEWAKAYGNLAMTLARAVPDWYDLTPVS